MFIAFYVDYCFFPALSCVFSCSSDVIFSWLWVTGLCDRGQGLSGVLGLAVEFRRDRSQKPIRRSRPSCEQVRCGIAAMHSILKDDFCLLIFLPLVDVLIWLGLLLFFIFKFFLSGGGI